MVRYKVIDKSGGKCPDYLDTEWSPIMGNIMRNETVVDGDAFVIRDSLIEGGFKWGCDFYISKVYE